jgi:hypothetical protein
MSGQNAEWRELLEADIAKTGSIQATADRLGYSRATISLIRSGKYAGDPGRVIARILQICVVIDCPHLGHEITGAACAAFAIRPYPTSSSLEAAHWRACRRCPNHPASKGKA